MIVKNSFSRKLENHADTVRFPIIEALLDSEECADSRFDFSGVISEFDSIGKKEVDHDMLKRIQYTKTLLENTSTLLNSLKHLAITKSEKRR